MPPGPFMAMVSQWAMHESRNAPFWVLFQLGLVYMRCSMLSRKLVFKLWW